MKEEYTSWEYFKEDTPINISKNVKQTNNLNKSENYE